MSLWKCSKSNPSLTQRRKQRGALAILFALSVPSMLALAGLAVESGEKFVVSTQLRASSESCALAAVTSFGLNGNLNDATDTATKIANTFQVGLSSAVRASPVSVVVEPISGTKFKCTTTKTLEWVASILVSPLFESLGTSSVLASGRVVSESATASLRFLENECILPIMACENGPSFTASEDTIVESFRYKNSDVTVASGSSSVYAWVDFKQAGDQNWRGGSSYFNNLGRPCANYSATLAYRLQNNNPNNLRDEDWNRWRGVRSLIPRGRCTYDSNSTDVTSCTGTGRNRVCTTTPIIAYSLASSATGGNVMLDDPPKWTCIEILETNLNKPKFKNLGSAARCGNTISLPNAVSGAGTFVAVLE